MTIWWLLTILCTVAILIGFVCYKKDSSSDAAFLLSAIGIICGLIVFPVATYQPISLNKEQIRQTKEREQIIQQIENLDETKDKVKLNEWILTYNDWVNDVNTGKEIYGWFSWHRDFDMGHHTIIELQ